MELAPEFVPGVGRCVAAQGAAADAAFGSCGLIAAVPAHGARVDGIPVAACICGIVAPAAPLLPGAEVVAHGAFVPWPEDGAGAGGTSMLFSGWLCACTLPVC